MGCALRYCPSRVLGIFYEKYGAGSTPALRYPFHTFNRPYGHQPSIMEIQ